MFSEEKIYFQLMSRLAKNPKKKSLVKPKNSWWVGFIDSIFDCWNLINHKIPLVQYISTLMFSWLINIYYLIEVSISIINWLNRPNEDWVEDAWCMVNLLAFIGSISEKKFVLVKIFHVILQPFLPRDEVHPWCLYNMFFTVTLTKDGRNM